MQLQAAFLALALALSGISSAYAQSCREESGDEQSQVYVDQCLQVSAATHPPCNADNPCELIIDEIVRGCESLKADAPDFCSDYGD
jgi:hypothetical protein